MKLVLPPRVSASQFDAALKAMATVVGNEWVLNSNEDRYTYLDAFALDDGSSHAPSAIVAPDSVEQIQAVVQLANKYKLPIWPIARGKNYGYGGAAPEMPGTVVLDLSRMKRVLEVNEKNGYCLIEPGVGFFDLYDYLIAHKIDLWMSVPGNSLGSVVGNALERGVGPQPYGLHTAQICGLEVVLPTGELVRTGTGAMAGSQTWNLAPYNYGPTWDQMFCQSNFGIVTKMGFWLMPAPEATMSLQVSLPREEDLGWVVDRLHPLRLRGAIGQDIAFRNYIAIAAGRSQRGQWYQGDGAMPEDAAAAMRKKLGIGWWTFNITLYGYEEVIAANARIIAASLEDGVDKEPAWTTWRQGDPIERSGAGIPHTRSLHRLNWMGGRGAHLGFSPTLPPDGDKVQAQYQRAKKRFEEYNIDYYGSFSLSHRSVTNVNMILFNRDDRVMTENIDRLFHVLVADAAAQGYGEYRTHLSYMDEVAKTFDFNDNALWRLNERIKDALDPAGVLAPGKQGIWPAAYRGGR